MAIACAKVTVRALTHPCVHPLFARLGKVTEVMLFSSSPFEPRPGLLIIPQAFDAAAVSHAVRDVLRSAPLRSVQTPTGEMSVQMSNCGPYGWIADRTGYRYSSRDPLRSEPWPALPPILLAVAQALAVRAGYANYTPDACLINSYRPGAKMGYHQDRDEAALDHPVVSLSLGMSARFVVKPGSARTGKAQSFELHEGDGLVLGGQARLAYHGISRILPTPTTLWPEQRINLTLRVTGCGYVLKRS